jgi:four helix bundle protein
MANERSFRDLTVWQEAVLLADAVHRIVDSLPSELAFIADQMRRSARSVHANIAEGSGRSSRRDYVRLLYDARGSLQELESDTESLARRRCLGPADVRAVRTRIVNTGRLLNALIRALKDPPNGPAE